MNGKNDGLKKGVAVLLVLLMVSSGFFVIVTDSAAAKSSDMSGTANPADMGPVQEKTGTNSGSDSATSTGSDVNSNAAGNGAGQATVPNDAGGRGPREKNTAQKDVKTQAAHPQVTKTGMDTNTKRSNERRTSENRETVNTAENPVYAASVSGNPAPPISSSWKIGTISDVTAGSGAQPAAVGPVVVVYDMDTNKTYASIQDAINNATSGDHLIIRGMALENISVDGKTIQIVNSSFDLIGDISVRNGGSLLVDPSWVNMSGNWYIDAGAINVTDNTIVQFNNSFDGEFGIQVNSTGTLIIQNGSKIQSNGTAQYWFHVLPGASLFINDSVVKNCGWNDSDPGPMIQASGLYVHNGTFTENGAGLILFDVDGAIVENSTFYNNFMGGIGLIDGADGNYIANNSFDGAEGIHMEGSRNNVISGNQMSNTTYGIYNQMSNTTYGTYNSYSPSNLLQNPGAETGDLSGWTIDANGGAGWNVVDGGGRDSRYCFVTSYDWDIKHQEIDLLAAGYTPAFLDSSPDITASEWFYSRVDQTGMYELKVELRNATHAVIASWDTGVKDALPRTTWILENHTFAGYPTGVRYVYFEDRGKDTSYWSNWYGARMDDASLTIKGYDRNIIEGNTISGPGYGIYLDGVSYSTISNNSITSYSGIYMNNSDNNTLYNNDITFGNNKYANLVAYWKMDESQWTGVWGEARDSSGNGHNGYARNGANTNASGYYGRAGDFDGVNDWVYISDGGNALDLTGDMTVEAWINARSFGWYDGIVSKYQSWGANGFTLRLSPVAPYNTIDFCGRTGTIPLNANEWYHVVGVMQGGTANIYVNGVLDTSGAPAYTRVANWNPVSIGGDYVYSGGRYFDGLIDDVRIFNSALSPEEINQTYNSEFAYGIYMKDSADNNISFNPSISDISGYGDAAIYLDNSSPTISYANMDNSLQGLVCVNGASPLMVSSQILGNVVDDVYVNGNSHPILLNTTFNKDQGYVIDSSSNLTVEWYLDVYVRDAGGVALPGAWVNLTDRQGNYIPAGTTDASGHLGPLVLVEYVQNWTEKDYYAPYNVYADDGTNYGSEPALLDTSMSVYITVGLQYVHNIEQDTWYPGIQPAVIMANPGEHLEVYGGTHNESALVDKEVHIAGVGSPLPVVNGNGAGPAFYIDAEGVEISDLNITNTGAAANEYGIYADTGGFDIHDNLFHTQNSGVYVDIYHYNEGSMSIGDMSIYNNRMEGNGIYFNRIQFDHPLRDSTITVGQIAIDNNWINTTFGSGIEIDIEYTQYLYGSTSVDMAGIVATGNHINSSSESFYLYMDSVGYYMYDTSSFAFGDIDISNNDFISENSDVIYIDIGDSGYYMYNYSSWSLGTVNIADNTIVARGPWSSGVETYIYDCAEEMYGNSFATFGPWNILRNDITARYGVYTGPEYCGYDMYDNAELVFHDWNIMYNNIDVTGTGLEFDYYDIGEEMYDNSRVSGGNNRIMYNTVTAEANEAYYLYYDYIGYDMYDSSYVSVGWTNTSYNTFHSNTSYGMYVEIYNLGAYMEGSSQAHIGDFLFNDNDVLSNTSYGIYFYGWYENGYYNSGNSYVEFGDVLVNDNRITTNESTGSYGIYLEDWYDNGAYLMDFATVVLGNFEVNNNTINSGSNGIYVGSWYGWGYYLSYDFNSGTPQPASCHVSVGHMQFNGNIINSSGDGIYIYYFEEMGEEMYGSSTFTMKNFEVRGNTMNTQGYGIYAYYMGYFGYDLYDQSAVTIGDFLFNDNIIYSGDTGIYISYFTDIAEEMYEYSQFGMGNFEMCHNTVNSSSSDGLYPDEIEYLAYNMYDNSRATFGDFLFNWNTVTNASGYAFYSDYIDYLAYEMYDNSIAVFGNFEFNNNIMHSTEAGVYVYNEYWGYSMYDSSQAYFGHTQMNDNTVNTTGNSPWVVGIEMDSMYEFAYEMYDNSYFEMGNVEICRNTVKTNTSGSGNGIEADIYNIGYNMYDSSRAVFHDFLFNDNNISAGGEGIYFEDFSYIAYYMYDYSSFSMGDVDMNDNIISAGGDGIYFVPYEVGAYMYYGSSASIGSNHIINNNITSVNDYGIYSWWWYDFGYELYENAHLEVGSSIITNNTVSADVDSAICTGPYEAGYDVYDSSSVVFGNYIVSNNTAFSNQSMGIVFYNYEVGLYLYDGSYSYSNSSVTVGDIEIEGNDVTAPQDTGIYFYSGDVGYDVEYDSRVITGDTSIRNNAVDAYDGLYLEVDRMGYGIYDDAVASLGSLDAGNNTINANTSGGYGLYLRMYRVAYNLYNDGRFTAGDVYLHDNTVLGSGTGMYIGYADCGATYNNAYGEIPGTHAYNNDITASDWGLRLVGSRNPYAYTGGTQVWGPVKIYDSTINSGNGTYIYSDAASTKPDVRINDVTFTKTGASGPGNGIAAWNGAATFEGCSFSGYSQGIYANGTDLTVGSSSFSGVTGWDINMTDAAHVFMVDDTFNKANVLFQDNASILDIGWYITINVITQTGNGVPYADVTYTSNVSAPTVFTKSLVTDGNGQYLDMLREYRQNITGIIEQYNNYNMTGTKAGLTGWLVPDPTPIDASKNVYIVLTDTDPPILGADTSDTAGTTGDPFTFRVDATDTIGMDYVTVYYRYGSSGAYTSAVMSSSDNISWVHTMSLPSNFIGNMEYYFIATDLAGNTDTSGTVAVPITDNDAPYGLVDNSPAVAYGPTYEFNMTISDNIDVTSVTVTYWFDSENHTTTPMNGAGPWTYTIDLNCSWNSTLHYYFTASDAAGNVFTGPTTDVPVNDNEAPVITADNSDTAATTGDEFHFSVDATDNFEIGSVTVIYWFGNGTHSSTILTGSGTYAGSIVIDSGSIDTLHYYFNVTDAAGNYVISDTVDVNVVDNDLPVIADMTVGNPVKGNNFIILGEVTDNVGVSGVYLEYWFDDGIHANESMLGVGDIWIFSVSMPKDAVQLHYIFHAGDGTGWNSSSETILDTQEPIDNEAPVVVDSTTAVPITDRDFTFSAAASDNVGVAGVYVEYWFDSGDHSNISMTEADAHWEFTMSVPADVTELHYVFHAVDTSDNWASTAEAALTVEATASDNEPPAITDSTTGVPLSGMAFTFSADVTDNIGVAGVYVEYWFDSGDHSNISMANTGSEWEYSMIVPAEVSRLHYILSARDTSGNWNSLAEKELNVPALIIDTEDPVIVSIHTSESATEGADFSFTVTATDNVGVGTVYVVYWTDENEQAMALLTGENGTYSGTIAVPQGSQLHFYPVVKDLVGNTAQGNQTDMDITPASGGGTIAPSSLGGTNLLLIAIIVILLLMVIYLAATRNKGGKGGTPKAAVEEAQEVEEPKEEAVDEMEAPAPENTEASEMTEENSEPEQAEAQEEAGETSGESAETEGVPEEEKGEVLDLADF